MVTHTHTLPPDQLVGLVRALADQLVAARATQGDAFDPQPYLAQAAPLFAALYGVNRNTLLDTKECKTRTQDARLEMDAAHLKLQNLLFERNHIEREIRSAEEYSSEYQSLPLHSLNELRELAASDTPPPGLQNPLPDGDSQESAHALMLTRLAFELEERKRFEEERKELGAVKAMLVKENQVKKARLEDLEKQLTEFVEKAKSIQAKMQDEPAAA